jgi:hypothetical protein
MYLILNQSPYYRLIIRWLKFIFSFNLYLKIVRHKIEIKRNPKEIMINELVRKQIQWFNRLDELWEGQRVSRIISNLVVLFFVVGMLIAFLDYLGIPLPIHDLSPFFAIELAFNVLLIFELLGLIFLFPKSVADSVGKQFEIISLVLLRDAFKEFGHYIGEISWGSELLLEILPILSDAFGAILIFFMTGIFYGMQRHQRITQSAEEQAKFTSIKN